MLKLLIFQYMTGIFPIENSAIDQSDSEKMIQRDFSPSDITVLFN